MFCYAIIADNIHASVSNMLMRLTLSNVLEFTQGAQHPAGSVSEMEGERESLN